ncbi:erythromycin esterase family protein [Hymenobacter busanensis]|nr:erythromycin esterase family protein [Hymenobacter busanensis]QHJ07227.1 hypothetical protein GUY19_08015 [Hymenobacter busanensis]
MLALFPFRRPALLLAASLLLTRTAHAQTPPAASPDSVFAGTPRETLALPGTPDFRLFDEAFYQNQLFLLGEAHGVQRPQEIDFALLRHLNQRAGVRHYLAEVDCAKAYYLNEYLRTGDEPTLRRVFASWVRQQAQWGNEDFVRKIQRIRALNATLPAARRIRFVGIDGLQDYALAADYLAVLQARANKLPASLTVRLDSVRAALPQAGAATFAGVAWRAQQALRADEPAARRALGRATYDELQHLLTNASYARTLPSREAQIFANYQAVLPLYHLENEKLYGLWGTGHVLQSPTVDGHRAFASRVRQSSLPARNKVVSLLCTTSGSRMMYASAQLPAPFRTPQAYTATDKFNHDGPLVVLRGIEALKATTAPGSTTLVKLDAPGAAACRLPVQVRYAPGIPAAQQLQFDPQLPATAYVQYLLLVRDSGPTEPPRTENASLNQAQAQPAR